VSDRRLYVYYRVHPAVAASALRSAEVAQAQLRARITGLQAELLRRPEPDAEGTWTWMESYRCAGGIAAPVQAEIEAAMGAALAPWLPPGARHVEVFETLQGEPAPCA
jgi:hypothetical protein